MSRPLRAVIHTQSLQHNLQRVRDLAPNSKVMAVIKADGYGHGIATVADTLRDADALAVASIDEAVTVHDHLVDAPSLCLLEGVFNPDELAEASEREFMLVVHSEQQIEWLEAASLPKPLRAWLKIDTGMNRLGIDPERYQDSWQRLANCSNVSELNLMSHFASADDKSSELTRHQVERFAALADDGGATCSLANSAGIVQWPDSHHQWVRPGIMLYGSSPVAGKTSDELDLKPAMTLATELVATKSVKRGATVGYGETWTADRDTTIGIVACGYGDGYPRHVGNDTPVLVNGQRTPIVGRVSMDMITVDLGDRNDAKPGSPVTLWGEGLAVDEIAVCAGTISYELLCQVTPRASRVVE